jgi:endonuclease/exonuclease/phosphatase family metal-dependent hydrolase
MLRVMTYNIGFGGVDDDLTNRLPLIHEVVQAAHPDVLAVQEANEFDLRWYRRLFAFEAATGLRGLLAPSPTGFHGAFFLRRDLQPVALWTQVPEGNRRMEFLFRIPGGFELTVCGLHLDAISPDVRLVDAHYAVAAPPSIVLGDFNNCRADDPGVAEAFATWPPRRRARNGTVQVNDQLFAVLERAGYVDLFRKIHPGEPGHTVVGAPLRIDYIFATDDLAARAITCDVLQTPETERVGPLSSRGRFRAGALRRIATCWRFVRARADGSITSQTALTMARGTGARTRLSANYDR